MDTPRIMKQGPIVPWLYVLPALLIVAVFIVYPVVNTFTLSFTNRSGTQSAAQECVQGQPCWGSLENYRYALTNPEMTTALRNNALWVLVMLPLTVIIGLMMLAGEIPLVAATHFFAGMAETVAWIVFRI